MIVFVHGLSQASPSVDLAVDESPNSRHLHVAIRQMQYESSRSTSIDRLVGSSAASRKIRQQVDIAGQSGGNVLIIGPPGSGRRNVASLIHFAHGPEMVGPLVPIECSVCDVESVQTTIKNLYRAQTRYPDDPLGRVSLLNVDQLTDEATSELLGFLTLPDFRLPLIGTASPGCEQNIHPELWEYLTTIVIGLPPLASRREDIPYLAQAIIEQNNEAGHPQFSGIDDETMMAMVRYSWPGELQELTDVIDQCCRNATPPTIGIGDLPRQLRFAMRVDSQSATESKTVIDLDQFLAEIEDQLIRRAVAHAGGNKSEAARLLGISRARLLRRLATDEKVGDEDGGPEFVEAGADE